jgi:hypothetical protein
MYPDWESEIENSRFQEQEDMCIISNYLHQSCFMLPSLMNRDTAFMKIINNKETAGIRAAAWTIQLLQSVVQNTTVYVDSFGIKKQIVVSGAVRRHWNKTFF